MAVKKAREKDRKAYLALIERFPLAPIRSDEQNEAAAEVVDDLLDRFDKLTKTERDYFEVLSDLVQHYESRWKEELEVTPRELLNFLMDQNSLSQTDLIPEFGSSSRVSEFLAAEENYRLHKFKSWLRDSPCRRRLLFRLLLSPRYLDTSRFSNKSGCPPREALLCPLKYTRPKFCQTSLFSIFNRFLLSNSEFKLMGS